MMTRPDLCPNCGVSTTPHTGTYCHNCGETIVAVADRPKRTPRTDAIANVEAAIETALLAFPIGAVLAEDGGQTAVRVRKALVDARTSIREAVRT